MPDGPTALYLNMQSFLDRLPAGYLDLFGILKVLNPECLEKARATAFTWAEQPGSVCLGLNRKYFDEAAANDNIVAIICPRNAISAMPAKKKAVVVAERADELFYTVHNLAIHEADHKPPGRRDIHPSARIAESALLIGEEIGVGANSVIHENCILMGPVQIGADCTVHANVMLGTDGLFSKKVLDRKTHIRHFGGVRIGDNCIVHAATNIARSVNFGENTILGENVCIGIGANIGHDCQIGRNTEISGRVMLAGRVVIGEGCWLGAGAVLSNAIKVGMQAKIRIGAVVIDDVGAGADVSGNFALDHNVRLRQHLAAKKK